MHVLVTDSLTEQTLIDEDIEYDESVENPNAVGTYLGQGTIYGAIYHGVKVWVTGRSRVYDWEPEGDAVFIQWTDRSNSRSPEIIVEKVHTVERPVPGGAISRFLVTVTPDGPAPVLVPVHGPRDVPPVKVPKA